MPCGMDRDVSVTAPHEKSVVVQQGAQPQSMLITDREGPYPGEQGRSVMSPGHDNAT